MRLNERVRKSENHREWERVNKWKHYIKKIDFYFVAICVWLSLSLSLSFPIFASHSLRFVRSFGRSFNCNSLNIDHGLQSTLCPLNCTRCIMLVPNIHLFLSLSLSLSHAILCVYFVFYIHFSRLFFIHPHTTPSKTWREWDKKRKKCTTICTHEIEWTNGTWKLWKINRF